MHKNVFIDRHKWFDVVEECIDFLRRMEELKPYRVEFNEDDTMKPKVYSSDCIVNGEKHQPIIVITHDEYTFFANNDI